MELRQLRYFVAVAEEGNFGRAAQRLRIAQSGLSQQVMALERSVGAKLFDRSVQPVRLTPEGEVLLLQARRILELADLAVDEVHAANTGRVPVLKIGGSACGNPPVADDLFRLAKSALLDTDVQISLDIAPHTIGALQRRELDIAFTYVPFESDEEPQYLRLGTVEVVLAVPETSRLAACGRVRREDLAREPVLVAPTSVDRPIADHGYRSLFGQTAPPQSVHLSDYASRLHLVAAGAGIAPMIAPTETPAHVPGVVYRRVQDPPPTFEYGLLWFDDRMSPALTRFLELARELANDVSGIRLDTVIEELVATG